MMEKILVQKFERLYNIQKYFLKFIKRLLFEGDFGQRHVNQNFARKFLHSARAHQ